MEIISYAVWLGVAAVVFVVLSILDGTMPEPMRDGFHGVLFMSAMWPIIAIIVVTLSPIWLLRLGYGKLANLGRKRES